MRIRSIEVREHAVPLTKPYEIASGTTAAAELVTVAITADAGGTGFVGLGAGTPEPTVTGETFAATRDALAPARTEPLVGRDLDSFGTLLAEIEHAWRATPAAAAALDVALHDLRARSFGLPLVDLFGRTGDALATSVTIGILPPDESVVEAETFVAQGFRALKLKIGLDLDGDLERIAKIRETVGRDVALRVDGNCGFAPREVPRLLAECARFGVELVEQPCPPEADHELRAIPRAARRALVADESIHSPADALRLAARMTSDDEPLYGGFVIKLMKCGGLAPARRIAAIAEAADLKLMWGCMDESSASIAAALHTAYASTATRWLDLDGSFDLERDVVSGGFSVHDGILRTLDAPGLGVQPL